MSKIIATHSKTSGQFVAFAISGKISKSTTAEIQTIVQLLKQKTGDDSINAVFVREGSIKLILSGSQEGLERLQALFESGELGGLGILTVEDMCPIDIGSTDARKARLIQALSLRKQTITKIVNLTYGLTRDLNSTRDLDSTHDLALTFARDLASAYDLAQDLDRDITLTRALIVDLARTRDLASAHHLAHDLARARDITRNFALTLDLAIDLAHDLARALALTHPHLLACPIAHVLPVDLALALARALNHALNHALALARDHAHNLACEDFDRAIAAVLSGIDLRGIDLSGANLTYLNLEGADLRGADLTYANLAGADLTYANLVNANLVDANLTGTIFGNNLGLTEADKDDLQQRGAIFQDLPTSDLLSLLRR